MQENLTDFEAGELLTKQKPWDGENIDDLSKQAVIPKYKASKIWKEEVEEGELKKKRNTERPNIHVGVVKAKKTRSKGYLCPDCGHDFSKSKSKRQFREHVKSMACKVEAFSCECPGFVEVKYGSYGYRKVRVKKKKTKEKERHMKVFHMGYYGCHSLSFCFQFFEHKQDLEEHTRKKHPEELKDDNMKNKFVCAECGKEFNKFMGIKQRYGTWTNLQEEFKSHMQTHKVVSFQCDCPNLPRVVGRGGRGAIGGRVGVHFKQKEQHMMVQHGDKHGCKDCTYFSDTLKEMISHALKHQKYRCNVCNRNIETKVLKSHMRNYHKIDPCKCPTCKVYFQNTYLLMNHKKANHPKDTICPHCGGNFSKLKEHIANKHTLDHEKKFSCNQCGKGLSSKSKLNTHMMSVHLKLQPYQCRYGCQNKYNDGANRAAHERRRHNGMAREKCTSEI